MTRFKPLRAGIINLWDYYDEEFVFADGRLALRGHNGSGKTKALEVLFPFILDGSLDARRLDPFSGENRTMKSNLLYRGQDAEHGYVWMEFDSDTAAVTLIIGLSVHKNMERPRPAFFVTDQRVGVDFGLLSPDSRPLTARQLTEVLGREAYLGDRRSAYTAAVDARLFGLGRERYAQLVDLLIALRRPLLAKDLDPVKVSDTLTAGLSPVDEDLIVTAARDFENLAAVQKQYDDLAAADAAVRAFLEHYTAYLRVHTRHELDQLTTRLAAAEEHLAAIRASTAEVTRATEQEERYRQAEADARTSIDTCTARLAALRDHDAYRDHEKLAIRREQLDKERRDIAVEQARLARARQNVEELSREAEKSRVMYEQNGQANARHARALAEAARTCGIDTGDEDAVTARRDDIRVVREQLGLVRDAERDRGAADAAFGAARQKLEASERSADAARELLGRARAELTARLAQWAASWDQPAGALSGPDAPSLAAAPDGPDAPSLAAALDQIGETDAPSLAEVFGQLTAERGRELAGRRTELRLRDTELAETAARLGEERAAVAAERDDAPPPSGFLDFPERRGVPLWRLTDFRPGTEPAVAAAVEGALQAAGLLTACVACGPDAAGACLVALPPSSRPAGRTLADILVPVEQDMVPVSQVADVLASIAVSDARVVTTGVLTGAYQKPAAEFIGATNRAARRRLRIAELDERIDEVERERSVVAASMERLDAELADLEQARRELPKTSPVAEALRQLSESAARQSAARDRMAEAKTALDAAVAELDARSRRLRRLAAERDLAPGWDEIDVVERAVADVERAAGELARGQRASETLEADLAARRALLERLGAENDAAAEALAERQAAHEVAESGLRVLERAGGTEYERISAEIAQTRQALSEANATLKVAAGNAAAAHDTVVAARRDVETSGAALETAVTELFAQADVFAPYAGADLRPLLGVSQTAPWPSAGQWPEPSAALGADSVRAVLPDGVTAVLDAYAAATSGERGSLKNSVDRMWSAYRDFENALKSGEDGYQADLSGNAPFLVDVATSSGRLSAAAFARKVASEASSQSVLLEDRERTVLEDSLLTALARQIHSRVAAARDLVAAMDADTRSKPMSSGMAIGIGWVRSDDLDERQAAVSRLLDSPLDASGLAALRSLLREMIHARRASCPRDTYREVLAAVLDYRSWHRFELRLLSPGSPPARLTRKKHSEMSGGEKSAAIHLPLFAAANALYSSAKPDCPRLVALDEAFAGIDDKFKPELLGLTVKFDLDLFMTGHDLFVTYPTVPMIAHYDMHHDKGTHALSALLVLWDGTALLDADAGYAGNEELAASLLGFTPTRHTPATPHPSRLNQAPLLA